ncbi:O-phosphoseryl-tRNA(Sec) selenium transferase [Folsomia candida]|uniref:O-phosphoseryl-tRNA(Sec) selenium transferase n=1 Tax=Folsomia candida TaxID=158441 RepID=A0A226DKI2_FOLCA|nr:O-phosphoseryl-tRNA(Sec) selenium transferase [Folsomia candida]OXA45630.1 O-phosphoseryl-tRNA(Sec) selenium transferase [Folsomia candida]
MAYSEAFAKAAERGLVPPNYVNMGLQTAKTRQKMFRHLMDQRKWPQEGWDDQTIEILVNEIASMDSNNFISKGGVGEREGRIYSNIVSRRHFGMAHGMGRSGDLAEAQPKAAGSSLLCTLTNALVLDLMHTFVCGKVVDAMVVPMATGMTISLCLQTMKEARPNAKWVIWLRIDQKSCLKAIQSAGLSPIVVEPKLVETSLVTDLEMIDSVIKERGTESILCVISTTSCFAPRDCDDVGGVAQLLKNTPIFHLVNNAYGIQSLACVRAIDRGCRMGRMDIVVMSTDKNLMVPVGGAIVAGYSKEIISQIQKSYPGRASSSQSLDVFITMLSMGVKGYKALITKRAENFLYLQLKLKSICMAHKLQMLLSKNNDLSTAISLGDLTRAVGVTEAEMPTFFTKLGSLLFFRNVQGARVIIPSQTQTIGQVELEGWGCHSPLYKLPYLTAASTLGMEKADVDFFIKKLDECLKMLKKPRTD